jgi:hexosaminidase
MLRYALLITLLSGAHAAVPPLMPMPAKVEPGTGRLAIDGGFSAAVSGVIDQRLDSAVRRVTARISRQTGVPMMPGTTPTLRVECSARGAQNPTLGEDESYQLDVSSDGARIQAPTVAGALHGLETFSQLIVPGAEGFEAPAVHIEDRPRFQWRGLMLDVGRHWLPIEIVERNLDAMAAVKLNVFHWHLSEDQGFRVESKLYPKLHQMGSDGLYFTQDEVRRVVAYARDRGIRVVPEFDIPGHTTSWLAGYPELGSAPGPFQIGRTWGVYENALDPTREETYQFLDRFLGEMAPLFPDPFFHIGGDEVVGKQWNANTKIQAFAKQHNLKDAHALQTYFNQRVQTILKKHGKIMIGWDEILQPDLPQGTVVQSWRGGESLAKAVAQGYRGILSSGYYLDHLQPAAAHYAVDPLGGAAANLDSEQAARILGAEACMWGEYVDWETVDSRIWPRAVAFAERLWSPREVNDVESMYTRMAAVSRWIEWTGVRHRANYAPMIDRLAGGNPAEPVRVLADAVEGLGLSGRKRPGFKYTSQTPLNRMADAARPESEVVHAMQLAAARRSPEDAARLTEQFNRWAANDARFQAMAEGNVLLVELKPLSKDLAALGQTGLKALEYLSTGQRPPAEWLAAEQKEIARMQRPAVEVNLAATRPVKLLLDELAKPGR